MKITPSILVFILGLSSLSAQISSATEKLTLPANLSESSGAIFFNNKLITHNDSGGENKIFELDTISGAVTRIVTISNATNMDWEDISQDDTSIFIGDIGNNSGDRTDLKIYKINKSEYLTSTTLAAETINVSYAAQTDFTSTPNMTVWDAEALVSFDDSNLILFSKNWVNSTTRAYVVPKAPGTYSLSPLATPLNAESYISGATYNPLSQKLYLVGYIPDALSILQSVVWVCEGFSGLTNVFDGTNTKTLLTAFPNHQIEAITFVSVSSYLMTSETFTHPVFSTITTDPKLITFSTSDVLSLEAVTAPNDVLVYPNPVNSFLHLKNSRIESIELYDLKSVQLYKGSNSIIDMRAFENGLYIVKATLKDGGTKIKKILKK